jgi:hypothetical protein
MPQPLGATGDLSWEVVQGDGSVIKWELVRDSETSAASDKSLILLRAERPRGHTYSALLISQAVSLVLWANSSFRGAARSLQILCAEAAEACPSLWSIRNWVLRLGLYELERPKERASDWALILDHTIQVGPHKALLILGARLGDLRREHFALGHQDVAVLGLEICERSNGEIVWRALERIQEQIGEPRLLVSDAGSDIKKAAALFCERHRHTDWIPDVSHRIARLLEAELSGDPQWESFLSRAAQCRNQCQQTALSPLMPPPQRGKARWMNYQPLVAWGLEVIQHPIPSWACPKEFKRVFGWLDDYEEELDDCWMMMHLGQEICRIIKDQGIDCQSLENCRQILQERVHGARVRRYASGIREYLEEVESKLRPGERLLGSSDIVESIFGKYKFLLERSPQKAITRLILAIGALTSRRTPELIRNAMEAIKMEAVEKWFSKYVGESARSIRQNAFG